MADARGHLLTANGAMLPYWLLFAFISVPAMLARNQLTERGTRYGLLVVGILLTLMIGLRYEVGGDWVPYLEIFNETKFLQIEELLSTSIDIGFALINKTFIHLDLEIWTVNLACAAIFTFCLVRFCVSLPNPWLALAVAIPYFVIVVGMGYTRQGVAISLSMLGLMSVSRGNFLRFLFWISLAATFHKSAIALIPIIGLSYTRNRLFVIIGAIIFTFVGYYLFIADVIGIMVTNYTEQDSQGAEIRLAMNAVPAAVFILLRKKFPFAPVAMAIWRNISIVALVSTALVLIVANTTALDRLALYFIPLQIVVWAWLPTAFAQNGVADRRLTIGILGYSAIVLYVWLTYASHSEYWLPYQIWPFLRDF